MLKNIFLLLTIVVIFSCSSTIKANDKITYADTGGFSFYYKILNERNGILYVNNNKDSVTFNYELKKVFKNLINFKTKKESRTLIYEYHIQYPENKMNEYEILRKYTTLISLKKKSIFRYESHTK